MAEACGTLAAGDSRRVIKNLYFDFRSRRALIIFDEAQHLSVPCLETVRELHDLPPHFGLLFAGSHQLERMFTRHALELEQWNSRFHAGRCLPGITDGEAEQIICAELGARANKHVVERLLKASRAKALSSQGQHEYISARRLFNTLRDLKEQSQEASA
jgi:DNA transposition AAA+ family ATPase